MVTGAVQILIFSIYYIRDGNPVSILPVTMYFDFGIKFLLAILMHMVIRPDLKQAVELLEYLKNPTQMEHVMASRGLGAFMLLVKFSVGIVCETIFLLFVSSLKDGNIEKILVTFVIFLVIYEAPLFIFKVKQGNN